MVKTGFISLFVAVLAVTSSLVNGQSDAKQYTVGTVAPDTDATQSVTQSTTTVDTSNSVNTTTTVDAYTPVAPVVVTAAPVVVPLPVATAVAPTSVPTADNGSLSQSLGLRTDGKAFAGSVGAWTNAGDGLLKIVFESTDNKDVRVNVLLGGKKEKIAEVPVKKGQTVTWTAPLADLQDNALYLDRWRPGLFGLSGTGGGWLQLWVPRASEGGHLELRTKINVS